MSASGDPSANLSSVPMTPDAALRVLETLRAAAPPVTAARLADVMGLLAHLQAPAPDSAAPVSASANALDPDQLLTRMIENLSPMLELIYAQSSALRTGKLGRITTEQADGLSTLEQYIEGALLMLRSLEDMRQLRQGMPVLERLMFSGLDLMAQAWQHTQFLAEARDHRVTITADDPLPMVYGDYQYTLQILVDLLDNAIRYTPYHGEIRMSANALGDQVLFSVADNGIGMTEHDQKCVGLPFWRAQHQALVRQHPGTGLRVFLAREILALQHSELFFSGEPNEGSTFSFALPADV